MRKDFEAFLAGDWSLIEGDFLEEEFFGLDGHRLANPDQWTLRFPRLEAYREEWLRQAADFQPVELVGVGKLDFFYRAARLDTIDIRDGRAVAHKSFDGHVATRSGTELQLKWQTLYFLRKSQAHWKITGFVGYLPHDLGTATVGEPRASVERSATFRA